MIGSVSTQFSSLYTAFLISLSIHLAFLYPWLPVRNRPQPGDPIPVAYIPPPKPEPKIENVRVNPPKPEKKARPVPKPSPPKRVARRRKPTRAVAPKSAPVVKEARPSEVKRKSLPDGIRWRSEKAEIREAKAEIERTDPEKNSIVRRRLPTMKELLPPVEWTSGKEPSEEEGAIRLDSQDPTYVSYLSGIKRAIELVWEYPSPALNQGIQGKLVVQFTVMADGSLLEAKLVRSSGFTVLDNEALRAVHSAAPFYPIPDWIHKKRLAIIASFEYFDNRLRYSFTP